MKEKQNKGVALMLGSTPLEQYNVKVYDYGSEQQIRVYKRSITSIDKNTKKSKAYRTDKEQLLEISANDSGTMEHFENQLLEIERKREHSIKTSANRAKNTVYEYARANEWEYFITITFDPKKVDSTDYDLVTKKLSTWLKNIKKTHSPNLKYVVVPELHSDGKKYHFHALFTNIGDMKLTDSGKKDKFKRTIYNIGNYRLGWTTATKIANTKKASNYISKYITKTLCESTKGKKRYWVSRNVNKPMVSKMQLSAVDVKKLLKSVGDQVAYHNDVDIPEANQHIDYYEIRLTDQ